jgi:hypothetical protein
MKSEYSGWEVLKWRRFCLQLRRLAYMPNHLNPLLRALCLSFCGAVEQTLLRFSRTSFNYIEFKQYLEDAITMMEEEV